MSNRKKGKVGILFPDGDVKFVLYMTPTKDGFTYGVDYSDTHITLLPEPDAVSFHITNQKTEKHRSLGRIWKNKDYSDLEFKALNPRKIDVREYDETIIYFTEAWISLVNQSDNAILERESEKEFIQLWDIGKTFETSIRIAQEYVSSPESFFGLCKIGELLSNQDYLFGITKDKKGIIKEDGELWEIELSQYYNLTRPDHPFEEILSPIGLQELLPEIQQRLREIFNEKLGEGIYDIQISPHFQSTLPFQIRDSL